MLDQPSINQSTRIYIAPYVAGESEARSFKRRLNSSTSRTEF